MGSSSRTYNSIVNSLIGIMASFVTVAINFVLRIVLVRQLGEEINGIHNLFQNIISVMTLMELGIGSAMIIHLYQPIKEENHELTKSILAYYKKIYLTIALIFSVVSIIIMLCLNYIVHSSIPLNTVRLYFLIFALTFVVNYCTYYKRSILYASQKNRISTLVSALCELVFRAVQIVLIFVYLNYLLFVILLVAEKWVNNTICNLYVNKHHPYLLEPSTELSSEKKRGIFNTVKPLLVNQMSNTILQSSRGILISIFLGSVAIVGYYGNYYLIMAVVYTVYGQIGGAFTSSFGNLAVDNDTEMMKEAYKKSTFIMNWLAIICCSLFIACASPFIDLIFGDNFVLSSTIVIVLTFDMAIYLFNIPIVSVQNAMGTHRLDAKWMIVQTVLSVLLGCLGGWKFGMVGILLGLLLPVIVFTFFNKGIIIGIKTLNISAKEFLSFELWEFVKLAITTSVVFIICSKLIIGNWLLDLAARALIAVVCATIIPYLLSLKIKYLDDTMQLLKRVCSRVLNK